MTKLLVNDQEIHIDESFLNENEQVEFQFEYVVTTTLDHWPAPDNDGDYFAVTFDVVLQCTHVIDESGYGETIIDAALVTHAKSSREEYQSYFDDNNDGVERTLTELARCKVFGSEVFNVRVTDINFDDYRN